MAQLPLTRGYVTKVSVADLPRVQHLRWCYRSGYAVHYTQVNGKRKVIYLHRLLLNAPSHLQVDHINRDRLDNRRHNLRFATRSQNQANKGRSRNNRSGYKGVGFHAGKWSARIRYQGKQLHLGHYDDVVEAAWVYDAAAVALYKAFAGRNFPDEPIPNDLRRRVQQLLEPAPPRPAIPKRKSDYRGVMWERGRWRAKITVNGQRLHLGYFDDEAAAAKAYDAAAQEHLGDKARLNFPRTKRRTLKEA